MVQVHPGTGCGSLPVNENSNISMDDVDRVKAPASDGWVPGPPFVWARIVIPVPVPVFPIGGRVSPGGIEL